MADAGGRGTLVVMGSGETSPTMVTLHQQLMARYGASPRAFVLDSPAGFQENVAELTEKAIAYFADSVGAAVAPLSFRSRQEALEAPVEHARTMAALAAADWVFAGPGSPTYALSTWEGSAVPESLRTVLRTGGTVVMASAASLTLGAWTIPVYEIYKVGEQPQWREGLDLVGAATGWSCAVVPHFDNNDGGGTHDTRFCYMGLRRLELLERQLPSEAFVLGVDEHTALVLDLEAGLATVHGRGGVTLRVGGHSQVLATGTKAAIAELTTWIGDRLGGGAEVAGDSSAADVSPADAALSAALDDPDLGTALAAIIALDRAAQDEREREQVRAALSRIAARSTPDVDVRSVVAPFIDALLEVRLRARADQRWADADAVRDALAAAGVEVRDTADGAEWDLR